MTSAEEFFSNCQIKPMKLSSHLQRPQVLAPLLDLEEEDEEKGKAEGRRGRRGERERPNPQFNDIVSINIFHLMFTIILFI